jgi:hypothetical protein
MLLLLVPIVVLLGVSLSDGQTVDQIKTQIAALQSRLVDLHNQKTQAENAKPSLEATAQKQRDDVNSRMTLCRNASEQDESHARLMERYASQYPHSRAVFLWQAQKDRDDAIALGARVSEGPLMMNQIEIALQKGEQYIAHPLVISRKMSAKQETRLLALPEQFQHGCSRKEESGSKHSSVPNQIPPRS